ncbi:hypothetical protein BBJ28_00001117 [Nothophytophthora sp. Chile5]|nr:hypothetical protein BBJ28_00001117 [Nothophytophthora sp. Chile5]
MAAGSLSYARLAGSTSPTSRPSTRIGWKEYAMTVASQLYFSSFYRLVYFFMIVSSIVCVIWTGVNHWRIPSSVVFISLEITVSALLVFEVLLRMMAFKRVRLLHTRSLLLSRPSPNNLHGVLTLSQRFWSKWCNIFDVIALGQWPLDLLALPANNAMMSLVSVAMYFNEEGVLGELEEVATDSVLALRNAVQYIRLAIFLNSWANCFVVWKLSYLATWLSHRNRSERPRTLGKDIDFEKLSTDPDDEQEMMLNAESGMDLDSEDEEIQIV